MSALRNRECDTAVAGGGNIIASPFWNSTLSKAGFLTNTPGGCKTFREDADGYCRAEAVGVVVLKRLEDAIHDNDSIIAVLRSYACNHSADAVSLTRPDAGTQKRLYSQALHRAALQETDITYVEMHGTGTVAGDSAEMQSVVDVFGKGRTENSPLLVSSLKANIGHSEAVSGDPLFHHSLENSRLTNLFRRHQECLRSSRLR
jgi:acyl transferase domain-containing protein